MLLPPFSNEPIESFQSEALRGEMRSAIAQVRQTFGATHPLLIDGRRIETKNTIISRNPSRPDETIGVSSSAGVDHVDLALAAAWRAFGAWKAWPQEERSSVLLKAANIMRQRKRSLEALLVLEIGKNYIEASAEVAEMIDFIEYYARQALRHTGALEHLRAFPGETNESLYVPLGAGVCIAPWNFPMALMMGMAVGAIVVGNTVVCKPAEDTVVSVAHVLDILEEAGVPPGVVNYLPGLGAEAGAALVAHPMTRFVNFTGSLETGKKINTSAAAVAPGQRWIKRVFLELGGKDAILVDETADLDAAALGIVQSAFGYQGQKCSACSRVVVVESVHDDLIERVLHRAKALTIDAAENNPDLGPLCNQAQLRKVQHYFEIGRTEGRVLVGGDAPQRPGYFFNPTLITDVDENARIAQEEVFGPFVGVIPARNFEAGLEVVNNTQYGLTGALFSRDRERIAKAKREFHVGNLYFNRKCTGALAGVQPFGGFNLSGTDTKTGGPDYLLQFLQMKSIAERL